MATHTPRPRRDQVRPDQNLCDYCAAKCCRYFALPIDTPDTSQDFDYIRWYLLHEHAAVFTEDGTWYLLVQTTCRHLQPDHRCGIYATRPEICRGYKTADCEYPDDWRYERYFETPEQVAEYAEAVLPKSAAASIRSPKPNLLPVLE